MKYLLELLDHLLRQHQQLLDKHLAKLILEMEILKIMDVPKH